MTLWRSPVDPAALARDLQQASFWLGRALEADVQINAARVTKMLAAATIGLSKGILELALAAEADGRKETGNVLREAVADQDQVTTSLVMALRDFEES
ncbi:hypothetical protein [Micromonospora sp. NPDC049679]|uniref:hypothetical protein n=1 Tax=Micromonospora sp. NPDC049679 TaxID=3155920 RepID=UPI0033EC3C97